jgi:hypothetical protein
MESPMAQPVAGFRVADEGPCPCGHPAEDHDLIADRYCKATIGSALARGCICARQLAEAAAAAKSGK